MIARYSCNIPLICFRLICLNVFFDLVSAVPALVAAVNDPHPEVKREILNALDKMADMRALPAFVRLSADSDAKIRDRSLNAILRLYLPRESGLSVTLAEWLHF